MGRPEITKALSALLEQHIHAGDSRVYWAREVTFDYGSVKPSRVDYMEFEPLNNSVSGIEKGDFSCYEIKSSVEDFHSPNGHNFYGDFNYYVMPRDVYDKVEIEISFFVGVLTPNENGTGLVSRQRARRRNRSRPALEMLLMMYRSFARDRHKEERQNADPAD